MQSIASLSKTLIMSLVLVTLMGMAVSAQNNQSFVTFETGLIAVSEGQIVRIAVTWTGPGAGPHVRFIKSGFGTATCDDEGVCTSEKVLNYLSRRQIVHRDLAARYIDISPIFQGQVLSGVSGGIRVAVSDVNGDGVDRLHVTASVINVATGQVVAFHSICTKGTGTAG